LEVVTEECEKLVASGKLDTEASNQVFGDKWPGV